jgi:predicted lipoprotein with Yx(FWY)xxD motif
MEIEDEELTSVSIEASPTPEVKEVEEAELSVMDTANFCEILERNKGRTVYIFTIDEPNHSNCDPACLALWPPLLIDSDLLPGESIDVNLAGNAEMDDGSLIVTYNQMPLYFWVHDREPGETTGKGFEGVWVMISPEGNPIGINDQDEAMDEEAVVEEAEAASDVDIQVAQDSQFGEIL